MRNERDEDDQDHRGNGTGRRRVKSQPSGLLIGAVVAALVGVLVLGVGGTAAFFLLTARQDEAKATTSKANAPATPASETATRSLPTALQRTARGTPTTPQRAEPTLPVNKPDDSAWQAMIEAELKAYRTLHPAPPQEPVKRKLMTDAEYRTASSNLQVFRAAYNVEEPTFSKFNAHKAAKMPAAPILPHSTQAVLEEGLTQLALDPEKLIDGMANMTPEVRPLLDPETRAKYRARLPWKERKGLYEKFATTTGATEKWSLLVPFDELNGQEMKDAVATAEKAKNGGLKLLTEKERSLLLRAGAIRWVESLYAGGK